MLVWEGWPHSQASVYFCSLFCVQCDTQKQKSGKQRGTPRNTYLVNDIWWMCEVDMGGRCPSTNSCAINDRASFLPVKSNTVDFVNVLGPGYRWSARWWRLVFYLNMHLSPPLTSTLCPPDVIHVIGVPRASLYFTALPFLYIILNANWRTKNWGRPGNEARRRINMQIKYFAKNDNSAAPIMWIM